MNDSSFYIARLTMGKRIEKNKISRNAAEKRRQQKQIKEKIAALQSQLKE